MNNINHTGKPIKLPSNSRFGYFFSAIFTVLALYFYIKFYYYIAFTVTLAGVLILVLTITTPNSLTKLNRLWYSLGIFLGKVISPIVLGGMFFVLITPIALITRLFGRDELRMRKSFVESYWVDRTPPGPQSDSFKNQF